MQNNTTLATILSHRSIRHFTEQPIAEDVFQTLMQAAIHASTSNHLQCVSIIRVTDKNLRKQIRELSGMSYVESCPEFIVFCADFNKHYQLEPNAQLDWAEVSLIGAVDTGITAQNVLLAAESLGLGGVYIGTLRNNIEAVAEILSLPKYCVPLVGMCLGYPAQDPDLKPRLPTELFCYENSYQTLDKQALENYNAELSAYYQARTGEMRIWQDAITGTLAQPVRPQILPFFNKQGLLKR